MADSDPRKNRLLRQEPDMQSLDNEEDPLVELARIVSEDSGFYTARQEKAAARREEPVDRNAFSADLEAELLQELESSFAPRTPVKQTPRAAPPPPPDDEADDLLRSIEEQLGAFERRAQTQRLADEAGDEPDESAARAAGPEAAKPAEPAEDDDPRSAWVPRPRGAGERKTARARGIGVQRPEARTNVVHARGDLPSRRAASEDSDPADGGTREHGRLGDEAREHGYLRDRDAASPATGPERDRSIRGIAGQAAGWEELTAEEDAAEGADPQAEYRGHLRTTFGGFEEAREAEPSTDAEVESVETEISGELEPSYADPTFGSRWQDANFAPPDEEGDEPRVAAVPAPDAVGHLTAHSLGRRRRSRKGMLVAAGLVGVVLIGGALAAYLRSGTPTPAGPPPVIAAPEGAVKVAPQQAEAPAETVGEAVYNRVAGNAPPAEEQVVEGTEEPKEISRIVLPSSTETDQALERPVGDAAAPAPAGEASAPAEPPPAVAEASEPVGPRRVRTYVVRPDGTIVEASEAAAGDQPAAETTAAAPAVEAPPIEPVPVQTTSITGPEEAASPVANSTPPADTTAQAEEPAAPPAAAEPAEQTAAAAPPPAEKPVLPAEETGPPEQVAAVQPTPSPARQTTPRASSNAPVDLLTAAPAPTAAVPAPAASGDGFLVQLSSQRSQGEAESSWASMKQRYSTVLGSLDPSIQQANVPEKGVYYRVRVGPWPSRAEAIEVCEALQAAGGSCFVTR